MSRCDEHQFRDKLSCFNHDFSRAQIASKQIHYYFVDESLLKLPKKERKLADKVWEKLFDYLWLQLAGQLHLEVEFLNNHIKVIKKCIFQAFSYPDKKLRLQIPAYIRLLELRQPMFVLSKLFVDTNLKVIFAFVDFVYKEKNDTKDYYSTKH